MKHSYLTKATALLQRPPQVYAHHGVVPNSSLVRRREFSYLVSSCSSSSALQRFQQGQKSAYDYTFDHQQLRFRRHDRASAFSKPRPPTKKKRRAYNRRMKKETDEKARHSAPGSKAGPRRQWAQNRWNQLLTHGKDDKNLLPAVQEEEEYTYEDAILEDLMSNTSQLTSQPTPEPVYLGHRHRECVN